MFSSLRSRLWLTYFLVVSLVVCIAATAIAIYLYRNPTEERREVQRLRLLSAIILQRSQVLGSFSSEMDTVRLQEVATRLDYSLGVRVAVFDASGELIVDSRAERTAPLPDRSFFTVRAPRILPTFIDANNQRWLYTIAPMPGGDILLLAVPRLRLPFLAFLRDELLPPFLRGMFIALVLSLLMAFWISRWVTDPLQKMSEAAHAFSMGEFRKLPLKGPKEIKALMKAFNEMEERVQDTQRAQRDFIANISHDLKTPLTSIQGFAQAILDGTAEDTASLKQAAEVIFAEANRMNRMVMDLLELAKFDSGSIKFERATVDLASLLNSLVEKMSPLAHKAQIQLGISYGSSPPVDSISKPITSEDLPPIIGDADRLAQAFTNLLDNAIKFTPTGGQVWLMAQSEGSWVEVRVYDTGPGIPTEELGRIFERFYQTDKARSGRERSGVGLGLAIVREIIQAHGGTIAAYNRSDLTKIEAGAGEASSAEKGSLFMVRLPSARPDDDTLIKRKRHYLA